MNATISKETTMRTLYKTLIMLGLAAAVALGVVWGLSLIHI